MDEAEAIQEEAQRVMARGRDSLAKAVSLNPRALRSVANTATALSEAMRTEWHLRRGIRQQAEEEAESGDGPEEFGRAALGGEMDAEDEEEVPEYAKPEDTDDTDDSEEEEGSISTSALMNIFEDEVIVDKQLSNLNSWVEDVDAQELLDEAQSLLEEMEAL